MKYFPILFAFILLVFVPEIKAQATTSQYFIKTKSKGGPLHRSVLQSTHMAVSIMQCSLKCLEERCCFGFNFNSRITKKYGCEGNCQLSSKKMEDVEMINGNDWVFYQTFSTDETSKDKNVKKTLECCDLDKERKCPYNWKKFDCGCYYISEIYTTWDAAYDGCRARDGDLAVPKNHENNQHIYEALKERNIERAWIGLHRGTGSNSNKFYTVGTIEVSYVNWKNGEPNNSGGQEKCVEMIGEKGSSDSNAHSKWNDLDCNSNPRPFICHLSL